MIRKSVIWGDLFFGTCVFIAWYIKDVDHHFVMVGFGLLFGLMDATSYVIAARRAQKRTINWFNISLYSFVVLGLLGRYIPALYGLASGLSLCRATVLVWYQLSTRRIVTWDEITA